MKALIVKSCYCNSIYNGNLYLIVMYYYISTMVDTLPVISVLVMLPKVILVTQSKQLV